MTVYNLAVPETVLNQGKVNNCLHCQGRSYQSWYSWKEQPQQKSLNDEQTKWNTRVLKSIYRADNETSTTDCCKTIYYANCQNHQQWQHGWHNMPMSWPS
jgi:hypothetical protein